MTEAIAIEKFLDSRNQKLYEQVSESFKVELYKILNSNDIQDPSIWKLHYQGDTAKICYYEDTDTNSSFTHELLHAYLLANDFTDTSVFLLDHLQNDSFAGLLFNSIIGHIQNIFAHQKMFSKFVEMGFRKEEFTSDYYQRPNIDRAIRLIERDFEKSGLPNEGICCYIASFYTLKDNRNPDNTGNFEQLNKHLRDKDSRLYKILSDNWDRWIADNTNNNKPFIEQLLTDVTEWCKERKE